MDEYPSKEEIHEEESFEVAKYLADEADEFEDEESAQDDADQHTLGRS